MLIGDINGYGCMPSYIPKPEKLIGGFLSGVAGQNPLSGEPAPLR